MPLRYLHLKNGATTLDYAKIDVWGGELRGEALRTLSEILAEDHLDHLWHGAPLRLWVTDAPGGAGETLLEVNVTALASD